MALLIAICIEGPFRRIEKHFVTKRIKHASNMSTKDEVKTKESKKD
jgi:hypothetical protein